MLANQFFMARKYNEALPLLEKSLANNPKDKGIKRKLVICYNQTGKLVKAAELFHELISEDMQFIIDADPINDDCPCPEIVQKFETENQLDDSSFESVLYLAILMLYCDYDRSLHLFKRATELSPHNTLIQNIYRTINNYTPE